MSRKITRRPKPRSYILTGEEKKQFDAACKRFAAKHNMKSGGGINFGRQGVKPEREHE